MIAGTLEIQLLADIARIKSDMDKAVGIVGGSMNSIKDAASLATKALGAIGVGLSVGALAAYVKHAVDLADELNKLSQRTGVTTEALSQLQYAARMSDVSSESLTGAIRKLNVSIAEGIAGDKQKVASFKAIGLTQEDLKKGTLETMLKIADAYSTARDGAGKVENAVKLLGKAGDEMIPLLNGGRDAVTDLMQEANKLGLTVSSDFAERAEEFNDNLQRMRESGSSLAIVLGDDLVKALGAAMKQMGEAAVAGGKFAGVIAFIQTLLTGDDRHKANVEMVQSADEILRIQDAMDKIRSRGNPRGSLAAAGDTRELAGLQKELAAQQERYRLSQNYGKQLDEQKKAEDAVAAAAKAARSKGRDIPGTTTGDDGTKAYEGLIKRIRERIDASKEEAEAGRQLTDEEKFAIKTRTDLDELVKKYPGLSRAKVSALLEESAAQAQQNDIRKADLQNAANEARAWAKEQEELAAAEKSRADQRDRVLAGLRDQQQALEDSNAQLQLEASLIGASDVQRQLSLGSLQIELQTKRDIEKINQNLLLDEQARALAILSAQQNAEEQLRQLQGRIAVQQNREFADDLRGAIGNALQSGFRDGVNPAKAFVDNFANMMYSRLSQRMADAITDALTGTKGQSNGGYGGVLGGILDYFKGGGSGAGLGLGAVNGASGEYMASLEFHSGGIAGAGGTSRSVPAGIFNGAPRYHAGGMAGDEVPAILLRGERVLNRQQTRDYDSGRGDVPVTVVQNLTVGDVASTAMVRNTMRNAQRQSVVAIQRAQKYGK